MSYGELAGLITVVMGALGTICTALYKLAKAALARERADARRDLLEEQSKATILAKNEEIADWKKRYAELLALVESRQR